MKSPATWRKFEDKAFENSLVRYPDGTPNRWLLISLELPGKSADDVLVHYEALVQDVEAIDAGAVELPKYDDDMDDAGGFGPSGGDQNQINIGSPKVKREDRKRGTQWTEEEHIRFLEGLQKYGKGDWRSIARNLVKTRTATQVASHAQKYFLRQENSKGNRESKRKSIHDITEESLNDATLESMDVQRS